MSPYFRTLITYIGAIGIVCVATFAFMSVPLPPSNSPEVETAQTATVELADMTPTSTTALPRDAEVRKPASEQPPQSANVQVNPTSSSPAASNSEEAGIAVARIQDPYPFPPESFLTVNEQTRRALVNILCGAQGGALRPTSGSGVIIDPRGVILTNAHVAQYVLLAESQRVNISCVVRSGAPARALWSAEVLYIPSVWIQEHATDITSTNPTGTGEHDYALLRITGPWSGLAPSTVPISPSTIPFDTREAIGFPGDLILAASYPAEFIGGLAAQNDLYPVSSITPIQELLTFKTNTIDLVALGGVIEAQSGSSGGPIVNAWGHLIGIITTTSEGATTVERELRALTLSYINRDLVLQSGSDLESTLRGDVAFQAANFKTHQAPALTELLIEQISKRSR